MKYPVQEYHLKKYEGEAVWELRLQAVAGMPPGWGVWFLSDRFWIGDCARNSIDEMIQYSNEFDDQSCWIGPTDVLLKDFYDDGDMATYNETTCCKCGVFWKDHPP